MTLSKNTIFIKKTIMAMRSPCAKKIPVGLACTFTSTGFNIVVDNFKKLNIINGYFKDKRLLMFLSDKGKLQRIVIAGDRGDPVNLLKNIEVVTSMLRVMGMKDSDVINILPKMGLMRGDDDPTIGEPMESIEDFGVVRCINKSANVTTVFGCAILPRY